VASVIIVTGTSRGLGRAIAQHYLTRGWSVAGCSRGAATLTDANYTHVQLDVADEGAVIRFVREIGRRYGRIDALINNAGIAGMNLALLTPGASVVQILQTNVVGTFLFSREAAKSMLAQKNGRIVNLVSVATPLLLEGEAAYAASKAAVENFTGVLARELGGHGITVNAVGPTAIDTALTQNVPPEKLATLQARQAIPRRGTEADVINVIEFFLAESSGFITGQVVYLGGVR
jgi:3-oxoacyl-[acyl-carrier protein] reductase